MNYFKITLSTSDFVYDFESTSYVYYIAQNVHLQTSPLVIDIYEITGSTQESVLTDISYNTDGLVQINVHSPVNCVLTIRGQ